MMTAIHIVAIGWVAPGLQQSNVLRPAKAVPGIVLGSTPSFKELVGLLSTDHESITFAQSIAAIESQYEVVPKPFTVGLVSNAAGEGMSSAKILCAPPLNIRPPNTRL